MKASYIRYLCLITRRARSPLAFRCQLLTLAFRGWPLANISQRENGRGGVTLALIHSKNKKKLNCICSNKAFLGWGSAEGTADLQPISLLMLRSLGLMLAACGKPLDAHGQFATCPVARRANPQAAYTSVHLAKVSEQVSCLLLLYPAVCLLYYFMRYTHAPNTCACYNCRVSNSLSNNLCFCSQINSPAVNHVFDILFLQFWMKLC